MIGGRRGPERTIGAHEEVVAVRVGRGEQLVVRPPAEQPVGAQSDDPVVRFAQFVRLIRVNRVRLRDLVFVTGRHRSGQPFRRVFGLGHRLGMHCDRCVFIELATVDGRHRRGSRIRRDVGVRGRPRPSASLPSPSHGTPQ